MSKQLMDDYFKLRDEVHKYFGYVEDWVHIGLDDCRDYVWVLGENGVSFAQTEEQLRNGEGGEYYQNSIYTQRFLEQYVYEREEFTMIVCDTHTDGNKFLCVFDNDKRIVLTAEEADALDSWGFWG